MSVVLLFYVGILCVYNIIVGTDFSIIIMAETYISGRHRGVVYYILRGPVISTVFSDRRPRTDTTRTYTVVLKNGNNDTLSS